MQCTSAFANTESLSSHGTQMGAITFNLTARMCPHLHSFAHLDLQCGSLGRACECSSCSCPITQIQSRPTGIQHPSASARAVEPAVCPGLGDIGLSNARGGQNNPAQHHYRMPAVHHNCVGVSPEVGQHISTGRYCGRSHSSVVDKAVGHEHQTLLKCMSSMITQQLLSLSYMYVVFTPHVNVARSPCRYSARCACLRSLCK